MKTLLKNARVHKDWKIKDLAQNTGIDQALISKYESGKRIPTKSQILQLAEALDLAYDQIMIEWLKAKVMQEVAEDPYAIPAIGAVLSELQESQEAYHQNQKKWNTQKIDDYKTQIAQARSIESDKIVEALNLEYTYQSNRIEGNTLTLQETHLVVSEGMTVSGKSMREHLEAVNHQEALEYIQEAVKDKKMITEAFIKNLHFLVLKGIDPDNAGRYRSVPVMIQGSEHTPPQPYMVPVQMEELMSWYFEHEASLHPVVLAAEMHQRLVTIHPFIDGNGRTSRLLMNLILLQNGYVIANIKGDNANRMRYYDCLEKSQTDPEKKDFVEFIIDVEKICLERYLKIIGQIT